MGVASILALLAVVPIARRKTSSDSSSTEIAELQARIDDLERQLENIRGDIDGWREIAHAWRDRADEAHRLRQQDHAQAALQPLLHHQITEEMRQRMMLQAQAQVQQAHAQQNQALAQQQQHFQNPFNQGLVNQGLGQLGQLGEQRGLAQNDWPYCNCVPGRVGFLRGEN